jgi:hypothetical protein
MEGMIAAAKAPLLAKIKDMQAQLDALTAPQQPFGWYDPTEDTFSRDIDASKRGATIWPLYRDAGMPVSVVVEILPVREKK